MLYIKSNFSEKKTDTGLTYVSHYEPEEGVLPVLLSMYRSLVDRSSPEEERELMRRIAEQDEAALAALYDRYSSLLFGLVLRIVKERQEAEDLLQDIFLQVWEKAPAFDHNRGHLYGWLVTLSRNRSIDRIRQKQSLNRRHRKLEEGTALEEPLQQNAHNPFALVVALEKASQVRDALQHLPQEQKDVIMLAYFGGYSQSEVAHLLDVPLGTVKTRTRQGMRKLHTMLREATS